MIEIDRTDKLYTYLKNLGAPNPDKQYLELANLGRYSPKDVQTYFHSTFSPSITKDLDDAELERVVDYYADLKKLKPIKQAEMCRMLKQYKQHNSEALQEQIINANLKDVLYLCLNYKSAHQDADLQDLIQTANIGVINALNHYKLDAKISFKDYIIYWVREEILKEF